MVMVSGQKILSMGVYKKVKWIMQEYKFCYNLRVIELGCYGMILGVDWMRQYNHM